MATLEATPGERTLPPGTSRPPVEGASVPARRKILEVEMRVGRAADCQLRLDESHVSNQHAAIRWIGHGWEIRDLGSRNGTYLDGNLLQPRVAYALKRGNQIAFGSPKQVWRLTDDDPPLPMVVATAVDDDTALVAENGLIAVPTVDDPQLTIYRALNGSWLGERGSEVEPFEHGKLFEVGGVFYRFVSPDLVAGTMGLDPGAPAGTRPDPRAHSIRHTPLEFLVSFDEEHVELTVGNGEAARHVRSRSHFYLLLTLARCRLEDSKSGLPDSACGWRYGDDLCKRLRIPAEQLNVQIFRIRREFSSLGYLDAVEVVERRPSTRQLRIGLEARMLTVTAT